MSLKGENILKTEREFGYSGTNLETVSYSINNIKSLSITSGYLTRNAVLLTAVELHYILTAHLNRSSGEDA
jgi:hypothetical protein